MATIKNKKLYRSRSNRVISGLIGGLGEYFEIDANFLRLIWIVLTALTGFIPGVIIYILAVIVIPQEPV